MYWKRGKHARGKENFKWMNRDVNSWNLMIGADGEISGWTLSWNETGGLWITCSHFSDFSVKYIFKHRRFCPIIDVQLQVCDVFMWTVIVDWSTPTHSYTNLTDLCSECNYLNEHTEFMWMKEFHSHVLEVGLELSTYLQEQGLGVMCAHSSGFCSGDVIFSDNSPLTAELYECSFVSLPIPVTFPLDVHSASRFHCLLPNLSWDCWAG